MINCRFHTCLRLGDRISSLKHRSGAACDFRILGMESDRLVEWILEQRLLFDSLYYYSSERPVHINYSPQHKRSIWTFTSNEVPTKKGIEKRINHLF
jgi:hypothetical protein